MVCKCDGAVDATAGWRSEVDRRAGDGKEYRIRRIPAAVLIGDSQGGWVGTDRSKMGGIDGIRVVDGSRTKFPGVVGYGGPWRNDSRICGQRKGLRAADRILRGGKIR